MDRTPLSSTAAAAAANASSGEHHRASPVTAAGVVFDEDYFDDIVLPPELFQDDGLDDDRGGGGWNVQDDQTAIGQQQFSPAPEQVGEHGDEERLVMYYHGQEYVFDSVQPQKIENIFQHLNGQDMIPQSIRPQSTNLVRPITVPENFDRFAALKRYREKKRNIKFIKKADYSARKEVALRMKRSKGKFAPTVQTSEDSLASGVHRKGVTFCTNCGERSDATPMMRHGPNGTKTFCNACGLMWANSRRIRKIRNQTSGEEADEQYSKHWISNQNK